MLLKYILICAFFITYVNTLIDISNEAKISSSGSAHRKAVTNKFGKVFPKGIKGGSYLSLVGKAIMTIIASVINHAYLEENFAIIAAKFANLSREIHKLEIHMDHRFDAIERKLDRLPLKIEMMTVRREIAQKILNIGHSYNDTIECANNSEHYNRKYLEDLEQSLTGLSCDWNVHRTLRSLFDNILVLSIGDSGKNYLSLFKESIMEQWTGSCGDGLSPNYCLYNFYDVLVTTELMGLVSRSFGYTLQHKLYNESVDYALESAINETKSRLEQYFLHFEEAISSAPINFRSCDPSKHIRNKTFFEMEGLYQTILVHEYGKNYKDSCYGSCNTISLSEYESDINRITCRRVTNCYNLDYPEWCESYHKPPRRYDWIKDRTVKRRTVVPVSASLRPYYPPTYMEDVLDYGDTSECSGAQKEYKPYMYYGRWCSMCLCKCEGNSIASMSFGTHVISLEPVESHISENKIITGVRFITESGIVQIQIKEGRLGAKGQIDTNTEEWKDIHAMSSEVHDFRAKHYAKYPARQVDDDTQFMIVGEARDAVNLDDITVPPGHVVTGVKFGLKYERYDARLQIQIQSTPFNFTTGELDLGSERQWISSQADHDYFHEMRRKDNPEKTNSPNIPLETPNAYVRFKMSYYERDAGQTTVPFLDGVPVESESGALSGIGLFYKAVEGYGGFLSFRLHSLNYAQYMTED